jgi:hypothetical protein
VRQGSMLYPARALYIVYCILWRSGTFLRFACVCSASTGARYFPGIASLRVDVVYGFAKEQYGYCEATSLQVLSPGDDTKTSKSAANVPLSTTCRLTPRNRSAAR